MKIFLLFFVIIFIFLSNANATTYTVCVSGCDYTSFSSLFSGVDLAPGDIVEARASEPGGSATFNGSIAPGSNDYGSAESPLIIRARSGDTITLDAATGQSVANGTTGIYLYDNTGYITFDGFRIINYSYAGVFIRSTANVTVQNCTLTTNVDDAGEGTSYSVQGIMIWQSNNVTAYNNTISIADKVMHQQTDCFYIQQAHTVTIANNTCLDQNQNGDGHNDGVQVAGGNGSIPYDSTYNITIRNNILVHDNEHNGAKQLIYLEYEVGGANYIYNNVIYNTTGSNSNMVNVANKGYGTAGTFHIYNNTLYTNTAGTNFYTDSDINFKNNIIYGASTLAYTTISGTPANWRNNIYYGSSSNIFRDNVGFKTWDQWKTAGYDAGTGDAASFWSDPLFVSVSSYPFDLKVGAASDSIDNGADLSIYFSADILGVNRSGDWDTGAYEGTDTTAPTASSYAINEAGSSFTVTFDERVTHGAGGRTGWVLTSDGGAVTATYSSGEGSTSLTYQLSRTVYSTETVTGTYTQPGNGIEDTAGNDFATVTDESITNNSTATAGAPTYPKMTLSTGSNVTLSPSGTGSITLAP